jgi:hypothetical protein
VTNSSQPGAATLNTAGNNAQIQPALFEHNRQTNINVISEILFKIGLNKIFYFPIFSIFSSLEAK